jgi:hypothetical protein
MAASNRFNGRNVGVWKKFVVSMTLRIKPLLNLRICGIGKRQVRGRGVFSPSSES